MAAATIPLADFTPYLLQQTALRASLLQTSFGFAADEWDDLRQDLALDCLRRLPKFDSSRGNWQGFVRGVVRHHACVLASRQKYRPQSQPIEDSEAGNAYENRRRTSGRFSSLVWIRRGFWRGCRTT
jgi:hypothetical protein